MQKQKTALFLFLHDKLPMWRKKERLEITMRNPSVEVMRCLLMFLIVLYHGCNNGPWSHVSVGGLGLQGSAAVKLIPWLLFFCTNSFMFISGWYGIRFSWMRVVKFLGMGAFAAVASGLLSMSVIGEWRWTFTLGWFGNSYLAVMMLAPIINAGLERLSSQTSATPAFRRMPLISAWTSFAAIVLVSGCGVGLTVPGWGGHAFSTMLFVYVTARVLRLIEIEKLVSMRCAFVLFVLALCIHLARLAVHLAFPVAEKWLILSGDYDGPEMVAMGASFFLLFHRVVFPNWLNRVGVALAPSMFVVYLLHTGAVGRRAFDMIVLAIEALLPGHDFFCQTVAVTAGAVAMFAVCVLIDVVRRSVRVLWVAYVR